MQVHRDKHSWLIILHCWRSALPIKRWKGSSIIINVMIQANWVI